MKWPVLEGEKEAEEKGIKTGENMKREPGGEGRKAEEGRGEDEDKH